MGLPMARNLLDAGYPLAVWNRTAAKAQPLVDAGATLADSPADLASRGPEVIFINVTDTPDVEAVLFGDNGLASAAKPGTVIVDHSTISPDATRAFAERLVEQGIDFIDAPVSGGDIGAQQGRLSIMVGGSEEAVQKVMPMLQVVGEKIVHLGEPGLGQACKACNQVAGMVTLLGVCEAMALAKKTGLSLDKMIEVVGGGAAASWQLTNLGPKIALADHEPGFMIDLVNKDLAIVLDTARRAGLPMEGTSRVADLFKQVAEQGGGRLGTQAPEPTAEAAEAPTDTGVFKPKHLLTRHMRYPNTYVWLLLLSSMDIMLTWVILLFGGSEVNPIARKVIDEFGLSGMIVYKFVLIVFFIGICEIVGTLRDSTGWLLSKFSVVIACVPVTWAMYLLWRHNIG
eukprot:g14400.t1